jgi:hypothetical protein
VYLNNSDSFPYCFIIFLSILCRSFVSWHFSNAFIASRSVSKDKNGVCSFWASRDELSAWSVQISRIIVSFRSWLKFLHISMRPNDVRLFSCDRIEETSGTVADSRTWSSNCHGLHVGSFQKCL